MDFEADKANLLRDVAAAEGDVALALNLALTRRATLSAAEPPAVAGDADDAVSNLGASNTTAESGAVERVTFRSTAEVEIFQAKATREGGSADDREVPPPHQEADELAALEALRSQIEEMEGARHSPFFFVLGFPHVTPVST